MTPEQFTYWLQGYTEIKGNAPTGEQWQVIKDHLQTVFHKVTPDPIIYKTTDPYVVPNHTGTQPWINPNQVIC